jgi:hypothetical protein
MSAGALAGTWDARHSGWHCRHVESVLILLLVLGATITRENGGALAPGVGLHSAL